MAKTARQYQQEIEGLQARLQEAEETLEAIRTGQVDAIVVTQDQREQVFSLQGAETAYRMILENMNEGAATLTADGILVYCNARFAEILAKPLDQVMGTHIEPYVLPADLATFQVLFQQAVQDDSRGEVRFQGRNGTPVPMYLSLNPLFLDQTASVCMVATDLSEQKRHEQVLASEERLQAMADAIPQLAWIARGDGFIHWYNRRWYEYTGTTPQQMEGWGWQGVHDPQMLPKVLERWKAAIATGEPFEMVFPLRGADGQLRQFLTRAQPLKDRVGRVVQWFGTNTNVDELKRAEQALHESQRQLQEMNRTLEHRVTERTAELEQRAAQLRAMTTDLTLAEHHERQRIAKVLHDHLQQLLVGAKFQVSIVRSQIPDQQVRESLDQVNALLDGSIQSSRSLTAELFPPALREGTFADALRWLIQWMRDKHDLQVHFKAEEQADPQAEEIRLLLFEAARELLFNVVKHAGVREACLEAIRHNDEQMRLTIADSGRGFDVASVRPVNRSEGGFGLSTIRERLHSLGGGVEIESRPGRGTRATLIAPLRL